MTIFASNIHEKSFTPYWASLAPRHYCHKHIMQRKPSRVSLLFQDTRTKSMFRWARTHILLNTKRFHFGVVLFAFGLESFCRSFMLRIYRSKNHDVPIYINIFIFIIEIIRSSIKERNCLS